MVTPYNFWQTFTHQDFIC